MKYVDEYRDAALVRKLAAAIAHATTRPWTIMEICGGQTHAIVKFGLDDLLPKAITLVHGPGCPVCVTSADLIDQAVELTLKHGAILCSFGDMLRVPGNGIDLLTAKARGAADLYEMIEEEMLLSLPAVAYHEEQCVDTKLFSAGKPVDAPVKKNPFNVLEQLKSSPKS